MRILALTLALLTPSISLAMGCGGGHGGTASLSTLPCGDGMIWSSEAESCVPNPSA